MQSAASRGCHTRCNSWPSGSLPAAYAAAARCRFAGSSARIRSATVSRPAAARCASLTYGSETAISSPAKVMVLTANGSASVIRRINSRPSSRTVPAGSQSGHCSPGLAQRQVQDNRAGHAFVSAWVTLSARSLANIAITAASTPNWMAMSARLNDPDPPK